MIRSIPDGVWPTMVTPFSESNHLDFSGIAELVEWYLQADVSGLFALCQSSEMFCLSLEERLDLTTFIVRQVNGRVPIIASGHITREIKRQVEEMKAIAATGIDAAILITNRFEPCGEISDQSFREALEQFLTLMPDDIPLGLYECPYPHKRLLTPELLTWCAQTGRFIFMKDTSCDPNALKMKIAAVQNTRLKVFNANAATLLGSLQQGASGYSGVLTNFFPDLLVWLTRYWRSEPDRASVLQNFLGAVASVEKRIYPICAKHYLQMEGMNIDLQTRMQKEEDYLQFPSFGLEMSQLRSLAQEWRSRMLIGFKKA